MKRKKISRRLSHQLSLAFILCFFSMASFSQVRISGKVTSPEGKGLPFISITVKGTSFGSSTDVDGFYNFTADLRQGQHVLEFTGVGLKTKEQTISIGSQSSYTVDIVLAEDVLKLDEVVVTGVTAGTTRRQLGSYISTVKSDQLTKGGSGNVLSALQGKTAGAQIIQNNGDPGGGV